MAKFSFCFCYLLGERVLGKTDIISKALQAKSLSAAEGQLLPSDIINKLKGERTSQSFDSFWEVVKRRTSSLEVDEQRVYPENENGQDAWIMGITTKSLVALMSTERTCFQSYQGYLVFTI